ncbi:hypothetical protein C1646_728064 [Rhizophagus diaphanus]|nr:hypothetical protein C1646_728064 [Rhizophagus diaphanus] [Rhizophagus sp. MUCL 43196]
MSSELELLRQRITELEVMNSELEAKYIEVMAENIEVKAENVKLSRALEENDARFTNLEQRDKEKTTLIAFPVSYNFNSSGPVNADDGNPNSINDDSDSNDSEEEMPDDSDDDGYNGYSGYNEYGEYDRGYYLLLL